MTTQYADRSYIPGWSEVSTHSRDAVRRVRGRVVRYGSGFSSPVDLARLRVGTAYRTSVRVSEQVRQFLYFTSQMAGVQATREMVDKWFDALVEEVAGSDDPAPSESVISEAKRIVLGLRGGVPPDTDVYAMEGGEVAVELFNGSGYGFLLVCEPGGSALCIVNVGGVSRRARYGNSSGLPDGFLIEGLIDVRGLSSGYPFGVVTPYGSFVY